MQSGTNALLVVKHRDMNEKELEAQVRGSAARGPGGQGEGQPGLAPSLPHPNAAASRKHARPSWKTTNPRKKRRKRWKRKRKRPGAQVREALRFSGWGGGGRWAVPHRARLRDR